MKNVLKICGIIIGVLLSPILLLISLLYVVLSDSSDLD